MHIMTITDPNALYTNTALTLLTNSTEKYQSQSENVAEQAINGLVSLGESFSDFFTGAQQVNETINLQDSTIIDSKDNSIALMQKNLFNSLGLGFISGESTQGGLDQLTSQSSIEMMQSTVLSALQQSLFTAQASTNDSSETTSTASDDETKVAFAMTTLEKLSFGEDGLDLKDGFDIFNILQHIPIVSSIYQDVTGQDISVISKLSGGFFYGGPIGLAFSALDLLTESLSGSSINDSIVNFDYSHLFSTDQVEGTIPQSRMNKLEYL